MTVNPLVRVLVLIGSTVSIGFGIWHFFVPTWWQWYSYIDPSATELVLAVRAINAFFSLSLVLLGVVNVLFVCGGRSNRYSIAVSLAATCALWMTRVVFQLVYPQGSANPVLQYGMLAAFTVVFLCYAFSLFFVASGKAAA
jgi:multisubunit Na+/H+ antiporter MnhC subunit